MTRIIAVSLSKGGVGKTTTAVNLAAGLAEQGKTVLAIDLDTQGQLAKALGLQSSYTLADLVEGSVGVDDVIVAARPNLWLIAGGRQLAELKREIARRDIRPEMTLAETLEGFDSAYDYVILDTAPSWDVLNVNALFYAREVMAPISMEVLSVQGLGEFHQSVTGIQRYNEDLTLRYVVPTFYDRRVKKSDEILEQLKEYYNSQLCSPIRYNVRLSEAPGYGETIFEYSPSSTGADDYRQLVRRVLADG
jgi:chromosome partitioning protein